MNAKFILPALSAAIISLGMPSVASAEEKAVGPTRVAVVDNELLMNDSDAAKSLHAEFKKGRDVINEKITAKEKELRDAEQELEVSRSTLSAEDYEEKRSEFVKQFQNTQTDLRKQMIIKEKAFKSAASKLQQEIINIVADIADEEGFDIVLPRSAVIIMASETDITDTALKALNEKVKSIELVKKKK